MWPFEDIFILPGVIASLCLDTVSARIGFGHLLLPAQLPRTHWVMICVIWCLALTVSDVWLKLSCFQSTDTYSALEVSHFMHYKFTTCWLTLQRTVTLKPKLGVIGNDTIRYFVYDFLLTFNSNYGSILHRFWHVWYRKILQPWNLDQGSLKVIETGNVR